MVERRPRFMECMRGHLLVAAGVLSASIMSWLLWPVADEVPWLEEVPAEEREARIEARMGPLTPEALRRSLDILDPAGILSRSVRMTEGRLVLDDEEAGIALSVPWSGEDGAATSCLEGAGAAASDDAPLRGLRILLDPGHHGGGWSEAERRHFPVWAVRKDEARVEEEKRGPVEPPPDLTMALEAAPGRLFEEEVELRVTARGVPPTDDAWQVGVIREGDLNWATARVLEEKLAEAGADVHLTRGPPPAEPFPQGMDGGFDAAHEARIWLGEERHSDPSIRRWARIWRTRLARMVLSMHMREKIEGDLQRLYNRWDLRRRSELAGDLEADLTLSIHYNYALFPRENYVVVFMPGHSEASRFLTASSRHHALARMVEGDLDMTVELGRRIGRAMHERMGMLEPPPFDPAPGITPLWWPVDEHSRLFARNLAIVRRTPGPVLLLEGPFMNNPAEAARLLSRDVLVDGEHYPSRVLDYAVAVRDALVECAPALHEGRERRRRPPLVAPESLAGGEASIIAPLAAEPSPSLLLDGDAGHAGEAAAPISIGG